MIDCAGGSNEIITVELAESTVVMAERLGLDLSQLANELLSVEVRRLMNEPTQTGLADISPP